MTTTNVENIDVQFRLDAEVAPTFKATNFNPADGTFEVYYNDGTLNNDEWYGPLSMDLDSLEPEDREPLRFQIAEAVYQAVTVDRLHEVDMSGTTNALNGILDVEQVVPMEDLMRHREAKARADSTNVDPVVGAINTTQVVNVYNEDDFDLQFEALTQALAEEDEATAE